MYSSKSVFSGLAAIAFATAHALAWEEKLFRERGSIAAQAQSA